MKKRIVALLTCLTVLLSCFCFSIQSEAASAKSILKKAHEQMKKYDTVFYYYEIPYNDNGQKGVDESGCSISDINISHSYSSNEQWHIKSRVYSRYSINSSWSLESTDMDNKTPNHYYGKKLFQYCIKNLKNPKIKKSNKNSFVIIGKSPVITDSFNTIEITISKKDYSVTGMTFNYKDYTTTGSDGNSHRITNQKWVLTHMCYGYGKLKAPKLLK